MAVIISAIELMFAAWVLSHGAGGTFHVGILAVWSIATVALGLRFARRLRAWTLKRLEMTHVLVERMVGHRTRLAQEWPERRNREEDREMTDYLNLSRAMDNSIVPVAALIPSGWMVLGILGLAPAFVSGGVDQVGLAIGLGGVLLANRAFGSLTGAVSALSRAGIAWDQVAGLFHAGADPGRPPLLPPGSHAGTPKADRDAAVIDASDLVFRYRADGPPVLRNLNLTIRRGERLLIEGRSGGGKSTLAALLVGLRSPESGLLLLNGLDRGTHGLGWHALATEAPQFHENHILTGTLGFNLLMGRNWPASEEELAEAREVCIDLGLADLLERMPSGMMQQVGETGWQLSHGERSRIYLARALLQNAELTILDESFAALDPETLEICLACAFKRARTLVVIAHP